MGCAWQFRNATGGCLANGKEKVKIEGKGGGGGDTALSCKGGGVGYMEKCEGSGGGWVGGGGWGGLVNLNENSFTGAIFKNYFRLLGEILTENRTVRKIKKAKTVVEARRSSIPI